MTEELVTLETAKLLKEKGFNWKCEHIIGCNKVITKYDLPQSMSCCTEIDNESVIKTDAGYICYNCYAEQKNPSKRKRKKNNEEERMQCKFFEEVGKLFPRLPNKLLFAVPNGGSRHIREAANLKRQGVTSGVSDVILLIPKKGYASLCIEFKTKKGIQSEEQKEFQRQAENCRNKYVIARSVKQGIDALKEYLL